MLDWQGDAVPQWRRSQRKVLCQRQSSDYWPQCSKPRVHMLW